MAKHVFIPKGIAREYDAERGHGFNLTKFIKSIFKKWGVPYNDPCCEGDTSGGFTGTINGTDGDFVFVNGVLTDFTPAP